MDGMKNERITMCRGAATLSIGITTAVPLHMRSRVLEISEVFCHPTHRRTGAASRLMQDACASADRSGRVIILSVEPEDDSPMNALQLAKWYGKYGFEIIQPATDETPAIMARQPQMMKH